MVPTRLAVRAVILIEGRLLLVNAFPGGRGGLWCAPGGGVEPGASLASNLVREVAEETGLTVTPGPLIHVAEFANADSGFHQVDLYFRAKVAAGGLDPAWRDPTGAVTRRGLFSQADCATLDLTPPGLPALAFSDAPQVIPDPLVPMRR